MSDPIASMFAAIRNGQMRHLLFVEIPFARVNFSILQILKAEGYIADFEFFEHKRHRYIRIRLRYSYGRRAIVDIKRISSPGRRVYVSSSDIPEYYNNMATVIISTSRGMMSGSAAKKQNIGGELVGYVF
jgi:small subunit ribosomal protein S8